MGPTVAIVVADRHALKRCAALLTDDGLELVASAPEPRDLARTADVIVIVCAPADARALLAQAAVAQPGSRLVVVLASVTRHDVRRAIRAGAAAVVRADDIGTSLRIAVQSACSGQLSIPLDCADGLKKPVLSVREKQILGMVVMGLTNGQVARRLFLAESTVKSHMSSIFGKLAVGSRQEAVALVLDPDEGLGLGILAISEEAGELDALAGAPSATAA